MSSKPDRPIRRWRKSRSKDVCRDWLRGRADSLHCPARGKATTGGNDPELSAAGQQRAEALARILKDSEITAIFTTEFKRTEETAAPTAKATQVTPTIVPANDIPGLVEKL